MKRILAAIAVLFVLPVGAVAAAQTSGDEDAGSVERLVEQHRADERIQTERPQFEPEPRKQRRQSDNAFLKP